MYVTEAKIAQKLKLWAHGRDTTNIYNNQILICFKFYETFTKANTVVFTD